MLVLSQLHLESHHSASFGSTGPPLFHIGKLLRQLKLTYIWYKVSGDKTWLFSLVGCQLLEHPDQPPYLRYFTTMIPSPIQPPPE